MNPDLKKALKFSAIIAVAILLCAGTYLLGQSQQKQADMHFVANAYGELCNEAIRLSDVNKFPIVYCTDPDTNNIELFMLLRRGN